MKRTSLLLFSFLLAPAQWVTAQTMPWKNPALPIDARVKDLVGRLNSLAKQVATAISDEARAMYNAAIKKDYHLKYGGRIFWTPNINIFRDPRWGRGQETYGEDPFLTPKMGTAFVRCLQGDNPDYLKVANNWEPPNQS